MRDKLPARMDRHSSLFVAVQHPVFITIDADAHTASGLDGDPRPIARRPGRNAFRIRPKQEALAEGRGVAAPSQGVIVMAV